MAKPSRTHRASTAVKSTGRTGRSNAGDADGDQGGAGHGSELEQDEAQPDRVEPTEDL